MGIDNCIVKIIGEQARYYLLLSSMDTLIMGGVRCQQLFYFVTINKNNVHTFSMVLDYTTLYKAYLRLISFPRVL